MNRVLQIIRIEPSRYRAAAPCDESGHPHYSSLRGGPLMGDVARKAMDKAPASAENDNNLTVDEECIVIAEMKMKVNKTGLHPSS